MDCSETLVILRICSFRENRIKRFFVVFLTKCKFLFLMNVSVLNIPNIEEKYFR